MAKKKDEEVFKNQKRYNFYIVMEYAPKGDLLQFIENHQKKKSYIAEDQIWEIGK